MEPDGTQVTDALRRMGKALRLGPLVWFDIVRATVELAWANRKLGSRTARDLLSGPEQAPSQLSPAQSILVDRVAYVVPRMGELVPWRADCLIQALAAQRWLAGSGIASQICIGVRREAEFEAHAWLKVGDRLVTGGDISSYAPLIGAAGAS